ncbi:GlsB/YeaQ/YmgE family stress response membrane protein [Vibrio sp. SS-MA-C1-2]|uniref:GlsB/YeaQ/YmgE family stress response membrane protein n=1 Tax=Vibrio sp. SS-MA-C1-2 TaxID=2908646 RepID=UPI001F212B06|nr:GlsB/YeaQ/YmgE family stress response membrane protein [Vibrio sp. SS-MA-C1-2]UJF17539.1 GlsB/YeaQ/YmgE family stress response membrane protein [Vibrio sp. SS-MA-C1-2]
MGIFSWIILGLIAGALARWLMPGKDPMGWLLTGVLGVVGAFAGGFVSSKLLGLGDITGLNIWSMLVATGGAFVVLFCYNKFFR